MDAAVSHERGVPVFFKRDLILTHLVVDKININVDGEDRNYVVYYTGSSKYSISLKIFYNFLTFLYRYAFLLLYIVVFVGRSMILLNIFPFIPFLDVGRVYKVVQWIKPDGEPQSILLDVFDVTPGEPIRLMEISREVRCRAVFLLIHIPNLP